MAELRVNRPTADNNLDIPHQLVRLSAGCGNGRMVADGAAERLLLEKMIGVNYSYR